MARRLAVGLLALAALPALAAPAPGRYAARLCVSVAEAAPSCGPAEVDVLRAQRLRVRISDIVYQLQLRSSQLEVVLMHGAMQIDEFIAPFEWAGESLQFDDVDKRTRYELQLTPRPAAR